MIRKLKKHAVKYSKHLGIMSKFKGVRRNVDFSSFSRYTTATKNLLNEKMASGAISGGSKKFAGIFISSISLYGCYNIYKNEGLRRSIVFWKRAFPIYLHYRFVEWQVQNLSEYVQDIKFNELHDRYAPEAMKLILDMGGFYIKIGQMGSIRDDFVPPQYMKGLKMLQSDVPYQPISYVKKVVSEQLGVKFDDVFSEIDEMPLGSASIGQVHRAVLRESGQEVVVKIQYPNVEDTFRFDMKTIMDFCKLAQPIHVAFLRECEKQFMTEFDYRLEAENLRLVGSNLKRSKYKDRVVVPMPFEKYCSKKVLVMDYVKGDTFYNAVLKQLKSIATQSGMSMEDFEEKARKESAKLSSPYVKENNLWGSKNHIYLYQVLIRCGDYISNFFRVLNNYTVGIVIGKQVKCHWSTLPLNVPAILEDLWLVHGHELFVDGAFNGDPHPGNILLLENGSIGLIDYGQVKRLDTEMRLKIAKMIIALANGDKKEVVRVMAEEHELKTKNMDPEVLYKLAEISWNRDDKEITEGKNIQLYLEYLGKRDPVIENNDELIMASRMCIMLRAMSIALRYPIEPAKIWLSLAEEFVQNHSDEKRK
eukprot:g7507.t1